MTALPYGRKIQSHITDENAKGRRPDHPVIKDSSEGLYCWTDLIVPTRPPALRLATNRRFGEGQDENTRTRPTTFPVRLPFARRQAVRGCGRASRCARLRVHFRSSFGSELEPNRTAENRRKRSPMFLTRPTL